MIAWLGARAAAWLVAATDLLRNVDREALPAIAKVNTLLDQASGSLGKVDTILDTAVTGTQATEDVVRKTAGAVSKPLGAMAEAGAFVERRGIVVQDAALRAPLRPAVRGLPAADRVRGRRGRGRRRRLRAPPRDHVRRAGASRARDGARGRAPRDRRRQGGGAGAPPHARDRARRASSAASRRPPRGGPRFAATPGAIRRRMPNSSASAASSSSTESSTPLRRPLRRAMGEHAARQRHQPVLRHPLHRQVLDEARLGCGLQAVALRLRAVPRRPDPRGSRTPPDRRRRGSTAASSRRRAAPAGTRAPPAGTCRPPAGSARAARRPTRGRRRRRGRAARAAPGGCRPRRHRVSCRCTPPATRRTSNPVSHQRLLQQAVQLVAPAAAPPSDELVVDRGRRPGQR